MLRALGWNEAAAGVEAGIQTAVSSGQVTADLARFMPEAEVLSTTDFGEAVVRAIQIQ
jgi:isocitrate dehydrogenase